MPETELSVIHHLKSLAHSAKNWLNGKTSSDRKQIERFAQGDITDAEAGMHRQQNQQKIGGIVRSSWGDPTFHQEAIDTERAKSLSEIRKEIQQEAKQHSDTNPETKI